MNDKNLSSKPGGQDPTFYNIDYTEALKYLNSSEIGLTGGEAGDRLKSHGLNEISETKGDSAFKALISQFNNLLTYILTFSALISIFLGKTVEPIAIMIIVLLAGITGFIQEFQANKAIASLKKMSAPFAKALRDGVEQLIPSSELVPGDIIFIAAGDKVPADCRIIEAVNLKVDEAMLTGESLAVTKSNKTISKQNPALGDRKNILFSGSAISYGRGKALVVATGMNTEFGKIAFMLANTDDRKTPLQMTLDKLGKQLGVFAIILASAVSVFDYLKGSPLSEVFLWGVALAVAIIPEALPAVVTITLALGVRRMVKRKALIRKLPAVETLGATNIICSDKTGTLTQDEMTIKRIFTGGEYFEVSGVGYNPAGEFYKAQTLIDAKDNPSLIDILTFGTLCSDASLTRNEEQWDIIGDPTEGAIVVAAAKAGISLDELKIQNPRLREIPFSSETKRMTTVNKYNGSVYSISKGAPETIINSCSHYVFNGKCLPITSEFKNIAKDASKSFADKALRVIGVAYKKMENENFSADNLENDLIFLGYLGMIDPPREEVKEAIKTCEAAGIKPIMITGDHKDTAVAVAKELGILKSGQALSGNEVEMMSDEELDLAVQKTEVFARISPGHKLKIVEAFIRNGNIVAMTGDGVNDAPSLKRADIGVAMGITGTDVSKEAADMILTDDNFTSIVSAVEEGRSIYENIRKYLVYLLGGNMGAVFGLIVALLAGFPVPLSAVHILFINFVMDGILAITLGLEPPEAGIMKQKPRRLHDNILSKEYVTYITSIGLWIAVTCMLVFTIYGGAEQSAISMASPFTSTLFYATLIASRLFTVLSCRSMRESIFKTKFSTNKWLLYGIAAVGILSFLTIQLTIFNPVFHTTGLSIKDYLVVILAGASVIGFTEIYKLINRKISGR